jgi:hypothetical protein
MHIRHGGAASAPRGARPGPASTARAKAAAGASRNSANVHADRRAAKSNSHPSYWGCQYSQTWTSTSSDQTCDECRPRETAPHPTDLFQFSERFDGEPWQHSIKDGVFEDVSKECSYCGRTTTTSREQSICYPQRYILIAPTGEYTIPTPPERLTAADGSTWVHRGFVERHPGHFISYTPRAGGRHDSPILLEGR